MDNRYNSSLNITNQQINRPELFVQLVSLSVIFFVTVFGNLGLIVIIFYSGLTKKREYKKIRKANPERHLRNKNKSVFSVYSSTYILLQMGLDRYSCICRPLKSYRWTARNAMKDIFFSWIISLLLATPQLFVWNIGWSKVLSGEACIASFSFPEYELAYILYFASSQFIIPLCILVYVYVCIFMIVSKRHEYIKKNLPQRTTENVSFSLNTESVSLPTSSFKSASHRNFYQTFCCKKTEERTNSNVLSSVDREFTNRLLIVLSKSKIKTFKLTFTVVAGFALCTLPFFTVQIYIHIIGKPETISNEALNKILLLIALLYQLNSLINPFIYVFFNSEALNKLLKKFR